MSDVDELQRSFTATINRSAKHLVVVQISLPTSYPASGIPNFIIGKGTTNDSIVKSKISKVINDL